MNATFDARRVLEPDAALAVAALICDLAAIRTSVPAAFAACERAEQAFDEAFVTQRQERWACAVERSLAVLELTHQPLSLAARSARRRLAAFVVENADLVTA